MTIPSLAVLAAACIVVFVCNGPTRELKPERDCRAHGFICAAAVILGYLLRLISLTGLPAGLSAEEALVGVQAKALWQTGGFYPTGVLTTMLPQWSGMHTGPLLAMLSAPFVGLLGISALTVRLPLVLLSIAAIPAAYILGCALSGKKAGRFMLVLYALGPYFVLGARMTCGANAALFVLPIAAALLAVGLKKPGYLYPGMVAMALGAYTQEMMLLIAPLAVIGAGATSLLMGKSRRHALLSTVLGLVLSAPAALSVYVNMNGLEGFVLMNLIEIPGYDLFADNLLVRMGAALSMKDSVRILLEKIWCTMVGGLFQAVWEENIHADLFMPGGLLALTVVSIPLMLLGVGTLLMRRIDGKRPDKQHAGPRLLMIVLFLVSLASVTLLGDEDSYSVGGAPDVFDHAVLFFFAALLTTAGWRQMQRRSAAGTRVLAVLLAVCFAGTGVHLFSGSYQMNANIYFDGFDQACVRAEEIQQETGAPVWVTSAVYPHVEPGAAAEIMYLYAVDADMRKSQNMASFYAGGIEQADDTQIYIVGSGEAGGWDWGDMRYEEYGNYAVIAK